MTQFPQYDEAARENIRRRLLDYKLAFKIGAPRLAYLIAEAHPREIEVDQRRVSRFLAKQTRPDDMFIDWCKRFVETSPVPGDPNRELATALQAFCGPAPQDKVDFSGTYQSKTIAGMILPPERESRSPPTMDFGGWSGKAYFWRTTSIGAF